MTHFPILGPHTELTAESELLADLLANVSIRIRLLFLASSKVHMYVDVDVDVGWCVGIEPPRP